MGLFDIFKKKEQTENRTKLTMDSLAQWIENNLLEKVGKAEEKRLELSKKVFDSLPQIKKSIEKLRDSKASEIKRLEGIINALKDSYVKRSLALCSKFPSDCSQHDFIQKVGSVLEEMNNPNPKEIYAVSSYFQEDSKPLIESIKQTQTLMSEYNRFMSSDGKIISQMQSIRYLLDDYNDFTSATKRLEDEIVEEEGRIVRMEGESSELEKELAGIMAREKTSGKQELEKELGSLESSLSSLEASIRESLSPLKRPLKKFEHSTSLSKSESALAVNFSKSPFKTFIEFSDPVIGLVRKTQESKIDLKDKDKEKLVSADIEGLLQMKGEFLETQRKIDEIKSDMSIIDITKDMELVKNKIEILKKEIVELRKDILSKHGSLEKLSESRNGVLSKIRGICLEMGVEIDT